MRGQLGKLGMLRRMGEAPIHYLHELTLANGELRKVYPIKIDGLGI